MVWKLWYAWFAVTVLTSPSPIPAALAQETMPKPEPRVTLAVTNVDVRDALRDVLTEAGYRVRFAKDVHGSASAELHDVRVSVALRKLLEVLGATARLSGDTYTVRMIPPAKPAPVAVYAGPHAARVATARIGCDALPDALARDDASGLLIALRGERRAPLRAASLRTWDRRGKPIGRWDLPPGVSPATNVLVRNGELVARAARVVSVTQHASVTHEWSVLHVPVGASGGIRLEPDTDANKPDAWSSGRLDREVRQIAAAIGWMSVEGTLAGDPSYARDHLALTAAYNTNRAAWAPDLSLAVFADVYPSTSEVIVAVRRPDGAFAKLGLLPQLTAVARKLVRAAEEPDVYSVCAGDGCAAVGMYVGPKRVPVVVCFAVEPASARVVAVRRGLLASAIPEY